MTNKDIKQGREPYSADPRTRSFADDTLGISDMVTQDGRSVCFPIEIINGFPPLDQELTSLIEERTGYPVLMVQPEVTPDGQTACYSIPKQTEALSTFPIISTGEGIARQILDAFNENPALELHRNRFGLAAGNDHPIIFLDKKNELR